jgi:hypothetical protein
MLHALRTVRMLVALEAAGSNPVIHPNLRGFWHPAATLQRHEGRVAASGPPGRLRRRVRMKLAIGILVVLTAGSVLAAGNPPAYEVTWKVHPNTGGCPAMGNLDCGPQISVKVCRRGDVEMDGQAISDRVSECTTIYHRLTPKEIAEINAWR